ncbi:MAG: phytoene desaturase family protein [Anaerolineales bacterium]
MTTKNKKIVIVGAGMAGLTAAAYLVKAHYPVLLLDKNDRVGGLVHTFEYDGFSFDTGPRAFVNSGMVKPILKDLGIRGEFLENKISIGVEDQLLLVDSMEDLAAYQRMLIDLYPAHRDDIEKIIAIVRKLSKYTAILYQFDNPNFTDLASNKAFIFKKLIPWSIKLLYVLRKQTQFSMPMEAFLARLTDNQSLIDILTQFFFRETPTYFALGYFYVYLDYFYPQEGTGALPRLLKESILRGGGEIALNRRIVDVTPAESKVTDAAGHSYDYDHLIWAADLKTLYRSLNLAGLDAKVTHQIESETQRMLSSKGAESSFILFVGVDRPPAYFQARGGAHMFYAPSREGLGETMRAARSHLIEDFDSHSKDEILDWLADFCRFNTYEVSIPALRDPSLAPEGQTGLMISCLFDYDLAKKIEAAGWYDEFKEIMAQRILSIFSETIYQGLEDDVLFKFSSTPLTIHKVAGSSEGAITGWSFEADVPVVNQLKDIPKSALTPIPGVLQAGQWAYSPAGVPIAMLTGWYATQKIIQ